MTSTHPTRRSARSVPAIALLVLAAASMVALLLAPPVLAEAASPTFSSISPTSGSIAGGTTVTITGSNFEPGVAVYFSGRPASSVSLVSSTQIVAVTPPGTEGAANLQIVNPGPAGVTANAVYYYVATSALTITAIDPAQGPAAGGTLVTVTGTGFTASSNVTFGGVPATSVTWLGPSSLWARTPPGMPGTAAVSVVNTDGTTATLKSGFTYGSSGAFTISAVSPNVGPSSGGTGVTITGNGFTAGSTVTFGTATATNITVVSGTQIVATTPPNPAGVTSVTVTTPAGQSTVLANGFTYSASAGGGTGSGTAPTISSPLPAQGFGLFVFSGGTNAQLVAAAGCPGSSAAFWVTDGSGGFVTYVPGTSIAAVNAAWNARFPAGLPANTPLIGKCA